jgi:hypothetical protein
MHPLNFLPFLPFLFVAFVLFVLGSFVFKIVKMGGLRGAMFGAPIVRTVGSVAGSNRSRLMNVAFNVHVLGGTDPEKAIGLELVAKSAASYQMMPLTLSVLEARKLIGLLEVACQGR